MSISSCKHTTLNSWTLFLLNFTPAHPAHYKYPKCCYWVVAKLQRVTHVYVSVLSRRSCRPHLISVITEWRSLPLSLCQGYKNSLGSVGILTVHRHGAFRCHRGTIWHLTDKHGAGRSCKPEEGNALESQDDEYLCASAVNNVPSKLYACAIAHCWSLSTEHLHCAQKI